jgi:superfamily I DNA/RNA helicase
MSRDYYRKFAWSQYQRRILAEVVNGDRNIAVEAVAGSGKSTLIKGIVHWLPAKTKIRIFAFNAAIADKLKSELPERIGIGTAHSYGYALVMGAVKAYDSGLNVDEGKYWKLAGQAVQGLIREYSNAPRHQQGNYPNLRDEKEIQSLTNAVVAITHFTRVGLPEFKYQAIKDNLDIYGVVISPKIKYWAIRLAMDCIIRGNNQAGEIIDFDDMLWLPHLWKLRPKGKVDYVLVDEAQDTSAASQSLYRKFVEDGAKLVAVGDSRQAINLFAGSLPDAFPMMKREFNCIDLPLPVTYRCPQNHVLLASQIVPQIQARSGANLGRVESVERGFFEEKAKAGDLVLSRLTAPLIKQCIRLNLGLGKKAIIRGKEVAANLCAIAQGVIRHHPMPRFPHELHEWAQEKLANINPEDEFLSNEVVDSAEALMACYEAFGNQCFSINQFCDRIKELFGSEGSTEGTITLSTIHRAKGDEADTVWVLDSDSLPPEREDWNQEQQEQNLVYVAITRAKRNLYFLPSKPSPNNGGITILEPISIEQEEEGDNPQLSSNQQQLCLF